MPIWYQVTYLTALGETELISSWSNQVTPVDQKVDLTLPVSTDSRVTGRRIYRTWLAARYLRCSLLTTVNDNSTTLYTDNTADGDLGATPYIYTDNTTAGALISGASTHYFFSGEQNVWLGANALKSLTAGFGNLALGSNALYTLTTGQNNLMVGSTAGYKITSSSINVGIGATAMYNLATRSGNNLAIGYAALFNLTTGANNVGIGSLTGRGSLGLSTGSNNVLIGYSAGYVGNG